MKRLPISGSRFLLLFPNLCIFLLILCILFYSINSKVFSLILLEVVSSTKVILREGSFALSLLGSLEYSIPRF